MTLPKVTDVEQVAAFLPVLEALQAAHQVTLDLELQIETPQAVLGPDCTATLARMVHVAGPRLIGLHYGTYDYSAALGIAAAHQASDHPAADFAKQLMQVAVAGTGAHVVDGSTNVLPVGGRDDVHAAWRLHARLVRRALVRGFYQGWDLHPAQLVTRYTATYAFFRAALPAAVARLTAYLDSAEGGVLDEPATARALASVLLRGLDCGALDGDDVAAEGGAGPPLAGQARRPAAGATQRSLSPTAPTSRRPGTRCTSRASPPWATVTWRAPPSWLGSARSSAARRLRSGSDERVNERPLERSSLFANGGELGRAMSAKDWSRTPVGDPAGWPTALRNAVRIC